MSKYECQCANCLPTLLTEPCPKLGFEYQVDCAKVSLDKFFDEPYTNDLCNQAVEVREMYCKSGDHIAKLAEQNAKMLDFIKQPCGDCTIKSNEPQCTRCERGKLISEIERGA